MTTEQMDAVDAERNEDKQPEPGGPQDPHAHARSAHIFAAIKAVMAEVRGVAKSGEMKTNPRSNEVQYNFQRYEDMAEKIGAAFRANEVMTQSIVLDKGRDQWDKTNEYGKVTRWTSAWVLKRFLFTSLVDGTSVQVEAIGEGADSSDKAFNKAQTAAYKVAFKEAFTLSTKDDVDPDTARPEIPGGASASNEVARNDPWGRVQLAISNATRGDVSGQAPRQFTDDQRDKVGKAVAGLPTATLESLDGVVDWAIHWDLLEVPVATGGTLAGALLGTRDALRSHR